MHDVPPTSSSSYPPLSSFSFASLLFLHTHTLLLLLSPSSFLFTLMHFLASVPPPPNPRQGSIERLATHEYLSAPPGRKEGSTKPSDTPFVDPLPCPYMPCPAFP